jgi:hypothetical protein
MYCVFCGKPNVISCQRCGRWVCPRHYRPWGRGVVCMGCRHRLLNIRTGQVLVAIAAISLIALTILYLVKQ